MHWYRGNTHVHTSNSDGNSDTSSVVRWYYDHGYQYVVVTDHETLTDVSLQARTFDGDKKFLVLPGEEVTQTIHVGANPGRDLLVHVNAIEPGHVIHALGTPYLNGIARMAPTGTTVAGALVNAIRDIRAANGIPQVNHPNAEWSINANDLASVDGPYLLEIHNPNSNNLGGTGANGQRGLSTEELWDVLLTQGKIVWGVGSDDAHDFLNFVDPKTGNPGKAWIVVRAEELTDRTIKEAIISGQFYASTGVTLDAYEADTRRISLKIRIAASPSSAVQPDTRYLTKFIATGGRVVASVPGLVAEYRIRGNERYVRAVVIDSNGYQAWTQPRFLR